MDGHLLKERGATPEKMWKRARGFPGAWEGVGTLAHGGFRDVFEHQTVEERAVSLALPQGGEGFYFFLASNRKVEKMWRTTEDRIEAAALEGKGKQVKPTSFSPFERRK